MVWKGCRRYEEEGCALAVPRSGCPLRGEDRFCERDRELAGSFINEPLGSEDYSVTVLGMERMTHDEYIERYGIDKAAGLDGDGTKSVICVEMNVRNTAASDSEGSAIELIGMGLNLANGDAVLQIDNELWSKSEPSAADRLHYPYSL